jgi:hypothetical protein
LDTPGTTGTTANSVAIGNSADWYFYGCSFDNVQLAVSTNALVRVFGGHFENPAQTSYDFFTSSGNDLEFHGTNFNQDNGSTFPNGRFGSASVGKVAIYAGTAFSPITLTTFVALSGTASASNDSLVLNSTFSSGWNTNSGSGYTAGFAQDGIGSVVTSGVAQAQSVRTNSYSIGTATPHLLCAGSSPTVSSGFNAGSVSASSNGSCAFFVNVGAGTAGSTGVLNMPTANGGWICTAANQNRADVVQQTANTTTSVTFTNFGTTFTATNWTNNDAIIAICTGF